MTTAAEIPTPNPETPSSPEPAPVVVASPEPAAPERIEQPKHLRRKRRRAGGLFGWLMGSDS